MTIACKTLYSDVLEEFHQGPNDRNAQLFQRSVNRALDQLSVDNDLATKLNHISSTDSLVKDMASTQEHILYEGVRYYMIRGGVTPADPTVARIVYDDSRQGWEAGRGDYWTQRINDCQAVDSSSVIGLGYVG